MSNSLTCASSATSTQPIIVLFLMILRYSQFLILLWVLAPYASSYALLALSNLMSIAYLLLTPDGEIPATTKRKPFRAVVVVEEPISAEWQERLSRWLVTSNCLYMMAWGINAASWDTSVDIANLEAFEYEDIPEENFVMTTWHEDQLLTEVFWFSKICAWHSTIEIEETLILHISLTNRETEFVSAYEDA